MEIGSSNDVAERIRRERTKRGLSYHRLAEEMARPENGGCRIQPSALQRFESGYSDTGKRPKLGVDELAAACRVFGLTPDELLTPIELVGQLQAQRLIDAATASIADLWRSADELHQVLLKIIALDDFEVALYAANQMSSSALQPPKAIDPGVALAVLSALQDLVQHSFVAASWPDLIGLPEVAQREAMVQWAEHQLEEVEASRADQEVVNEAREALAAARGLLGVAKRRKEER